MVGKPCQHKPQGDAWSVLSCGILQMICLCVDFWCAVSLSLGGILRLVLAAKEDAHAWRNPLLVVTGGIRESEMPFLLLGVAGFLSSDQPLTLRLSPPPCSSAGLPGVSRRQQVWRLYEDSHSVHEGRLDLSHAFETTWGEREVKFLFFQFSCGCCFFAPFAALPVSHASCK